MTRLIKNLSEPKNILLIAVFYTLLITVAFLMPGSEIPIVKYPFIDKLVHVLFHWALCFVWLLYAFLCDKNHISVRIVFVISFICFSYGIAIEVLQHYFTLSRKFDLFDIFANGIGCLIGLFFFRVIQNKIIN